MIRLLLIILDELSMISSVRMIIESVLMLPKRKFALKNRNQWKAQSRMANLPEKRSSRLELIKNALVGTNRMLWRALKLR